jgi:hypothetical protein
LQKHGIGQKYAVEISGVAWLDLLGYGDMLRKTRFNPTDPMALAAIRRLKMFQKIAAAHATRHVRAMIINDGVAYVRELSPRGSFATYEFLAQVHKAFEAVNTAEHQVGQIGARMIVAAGPRLHVLESLNPNISHLRSILNRLNAAKITPQQAVMEAFNVVAPTGSQLSLQANFAFTKAFLADKDGSRAGFKGPKCFIDKEFFHSLPSWISSKKTIAWSTEGMDGDFFEIESLNPEEGLITSYSGLRNAVEIAASLGIEYPIRTGEPTRSVRI